MDAPKNDTAEVGLHPMLALTGIRDANCDKHENPPLQLPTLTIIGTMSHQSIFCITHSHFQANQIVDQLKIAKIPDAEISTLSADHRATHEFVSRVEHGAIEATLAGALLGASWGWLAGIGAMAIPGAGLFIAGGPIIAAMSGATLGAALGGICGGLIGMGVPEIEAKSYEGKILKGNILLSVHDCDRVAIDRIKSIFHRAEASDIYSTASSLP